MNNHRVAIVDCFSCGGRLAVIDLVEHVTPAGVELGETFIKCESGCSKRKILAASYRSCPPLPESLFLEIIGIARQAGKRISSADKDKELTIMFRGRGT